MMAATHGWVRVEREVRHCGPNSWSLRLNWFTWIAFEFQAAVWARGIEDCRDVGEGPEQVFEINTEPMPPVWKVPEDETTIAPWARGWDQHKDPAEKNE